jgi:hypothetical protein
MKPKPWEGPQWKLAEERILYAETMLDSVQDIFWKEGMITGYKRLLLALKLDYEDEDL